MRLFIDCTDTHANGMNTGIQRVVRNIAKHCAAAGARLGMTCVPVILVDGRYTAVAGIGLGRQKQRKFAIRYAANKGYFLFVRQLAAPLPRVWQRFLTGSKHEPSLARVIVGLCSPLVRLWRMVRCSADKPPVMLPSVEFMQGDILLLADCVWNYSPWAAVCAARAAGARVAAVVYDIIPLTHEQFFALSSRACFVTAIPLLFEYADSFLCISAYTELQLRTYYAAQPYSRTLGSKKFAAFTLGVELDSFDPGGPIRTKIVSLFCPDRPVYLVVGTLEPRKNHAYLLQVFQALWDAGSPAALLIVGRVGWMCDELLDAIRRHPLAGRQLFFMDDVTDTELDYCYTHARALLFPAIVEGFGLPIIEALHKGLPVFASDIPVFHEVGGAHVAYFDHTAPASLVGLLQAYEATGTYPARPPAGFIWPDWSASTTELFTHLSVLTSP
jgi:alpha-1,2-rhamnosyltransferase